MFACKRVGRKLWIGVAVSMICSFTLLTLVLPAAHHAADSWKADVVAQHIADDLWSVQQLARNRNRDQRITFAPDANQYELPVWSDGAITTKTVDLGRWPFWASLVEADFGGDSSVTFQMWGTSDESGHVVVDVGSGHRRRIVLDSIVGRTRVERIEEKP